MKTLAIITILAFFILVSIGCIGQDTAQPKTTAPRSEAPKEIIPSNLEVRVLLNESFEEACKIFGRDSGLNHTQKEEIFSSEYKERYVKWTGEVTEVMELPGLVIIDVKHSPSCDISIHYEGTEMEEMLLIEEGDNVIFTTMLASPSVRPSLIAITG